MHIKQAKLNGNEVKCFSKNEIIFFYLFTFCGIWFAVLNEAKANIIRQHIRHLGSSFLEHCLYWIVVCGWPSILYRWYFLTNPFGVFRRSQCRHHFKQNKTKQKPLPPPSLASSSSSSSYQLLHSNNSTNNTINDDHS